jgi:CelD/BcsL family acetyltransferase involved in cellulose biosynthesis
MADEIEIEILTQPADLGALEQDWQRLYRSTGGHFSQSFSWRSLGWMHVGQPRGRRLFVVVGRAQGKVVLIWPMMIERRWGLRIARWLGPEAYDFGDVLLEQSPNGNKWLDDAFIAIQHSNQVDILRMYYLQEDATLNLWLKARKRNAPAPQNTFVIRRDAWSDWSSYLNSRSRKLRYNLKSRLRRLGELGKVDICIVQSPEELDDAVAWTLQQKMRWVDKTQIDAPTITGVESRHFLSEVAKHAYQCNELIVCTLRVDDRLAATHIAFNSSKHLDLWMSARDLKLDRFSPSLLALRYLFERVFENNMTRIIDFGPGQEPYKSEWADGKLRFDNYLIPCSLPGQLVVWLRNGKYKIMRKKHRKIPSKKDLGDKHA